MKKELLTILCMTLVCASVMLGIMSVYRITGTKRYRIQSNDGFKTAAFKLTATDNEI